MHSTDLGSFGQCKLVSLDCSLTRIRNGLAIIPYLTPGWL